MPADASARWTSLDDLRAASQKAWHKGSLLRELLLPTEAHPRRRALKHPSATELRDEYTAARGWAAALYAGLSGLAVETATVGRTTVGANSVPAAVVFETAQDEIDFIGKRRQAGRFLGLAAQLADLEPALQQWAAKRPIALLELDTAALTAAKVALWLRDHPQPGIYLRQLSLPGVHTKFIENHRRTIDEMVSVLRPAAVPGGDAADPAGPVPGARFAARHGFLSAPELVRFRMLDPHLPLLGAARDLTVTAAAFATLNLPVRTVIVTENQVNFLALPERPGTLALFGGGYGFSSLSEAGWLRDCEVLYWGDLDTHGFRILDQLRSNHPHVRSVMMDLETLLAHKEFWGTETKPSRAVLTRLSPDEAEVYAALGNHTYGTAVRLEQEHIQWEWARDRLT